MLNRPARFFLPLFLPFLRLQGYNGSNNKIRIIRVNENYQSLDGAGHEKVKKTIIGLRPSKKNVSCPDSFKKNANGRFL